MSATSSQSGVFRAGLTVGVLAPIGYGTLFASAAVALATSLLGVPPMLVFAAAGYGLACSLVGLAGTYCFPEDTFFKGQTIGNYVSGYLALALGTAALVL
jgi:hypothetical protein